MDAKENKQQAAYNIAPVIRSIRDTRVILDADLAKIYGVQTKHLNQTYRRNLDRFPSDFAFQLTNEELANLRSQFVISSSDVSLRSQIVTLKTGRGKHSKYPPIAFTEHGALMAATILNSAESVAMSVYVIRAFIKMREQLAANAEILKRLSEIDKTLLVHDSALRDIYQKLRPLLDPPPVPSKPQIGFHIKEQATRYRIGRQRTRIR